MDATSSKVLGIVIKNETESGAQCPGDFEMTGLNEKKLREILNQLADDGKSHPVCRITQIKFKDISTAPSTMITSSQPRKIRNIPCSEVITAKPIMYLALLKFLQNSPL